MLIESLKHEHVTPFLTHLFLVDGMLLLQMTDYAELVSRPGDFATLRQKNKDGMYTALEQFEVRFLTQLHSLSFQFYCFNFHPRD